MTAPQNGQCGTMLFKVGSDAGRCPDAPGIPQNASDPVGIPLKSGHSGAKW